MGEASRGNAPWVVAPCVVAPQEVAPWEEAPEEEVPSHLAEAVTPEASPEKRCLDCCIKVISVHWSPA